MSLLVWLPLNGDTRNQGLLNIDMTGNPESWTSGKLGNAARFNGNVSNCIYNNTTSLNFTNNFSFALWIKQTYTGTTAQFAFTVGRADTGGYGYGLQVLSASDVCLRFGNVLKNITCPSGEWHHFAMTVSGNTISYYKDGTLAGTQATSTLPSYSDGNGLGLGCFHYSGNIYPFYGEMCDFRIYNHVLSAKEVKEIAKGLVIHYPLSREGFGCDNLVQNSVNFSGWSINSMYSSSVDSDGFTVKSLTRSGVTTNEWVRIVTPMIPYSDVQNGIVVSFMFKCDNYSNLDHQCICSIQTYNSSGGTRLGWVEPWLSSSQIMHEDLVNGKWIRVIAYFTSANVALNNADTSQSVAKINVSFNLVKNGSVYFKKIKVEKGTSLDQATPWVPHSSDELYSGMGLNGTTVYDVSGFQNNGTRSGTINYSDNTPKYDVCSVFTSGSYISVPINTTEFANSFTICYWGVFTGNSQMISGSSNGNRLNLDSNNNGFYHNTGDATGNPFQDTSGKLVANTNYINTLRFYAVTGDGTTNTLYIDGVKVGTSKTYKPFTSTSMYINGWDSSINYSPNNRVSDYRIYATCLSDADILELYNESLEASDLIYTFLVNENGDLLVDQNGNILY